MAYQCPYTPIELGILNPHQFEYADRVTLPDGRVGTVSKTGYKYGFVDADTGPDWKGPLSDLRPATAAEIGRPRIIQLSLLGD
jgi:hypothetical protein